MSKFELNDIINADWLRNENVAIRLEQEKVPLKAFFIARLLKKQLPEYSKADIVKFLLSVLYNVERRTIYTWIERGFDPKKAYPKYYKSYVEKLPGSSKEPFIIQIITKEKQPRVLGDVTACIDAIETAVFRPVQSNKPDLNLKLIIEKRDQALIKEPMKFDNTQTMEELVVKMCEDFATGLITITEACAKHGLTYLQFVEVLTTSDHCRMVYEKACRYANMLQNSRQLTLVDNMIVQLLTAGQHVTEQITFEKYLVPGQLEPKWIEKRKTRTVRQLNPGEIITLKMLLTKAHVMGTSEESNEFSSMNEAELMDYVVKNSEALQKMLSNNPTINKPDDVEK